MKAFLAMMFFVFMIGCATMDSVVKVEDFSYKDKEVWLASSDGVYDFQGKFVTVFYSEVKTVGLKFEEPLGVGWKKLGVKGGDIWLGIADIVYLKPEDWRNVWTVIKGRIHQEVFTVGILRLESEGSYAKELVWFVLRKKHL